MTADIAHDLLGTKPTDAPEIIVRAYHKRHAELDRQITDAPTPNLKKRRMEDLKQLEEAYSILLSDLNDTRPADPIEPPKSSEPPPKRHVRHQDELPPPKPKFSLKEHLASMPPWAPSALVVAGVALLLLAVISITEDEGNAANSGHGGAAAAGHQEQGPPLTADAAIKEGFDRISAGDHEAAIKAFRQALELDPKNTVAATQLDKLLSSVGRITVTTRPPGAFAEVVAAGAQKTGILEKQTPATFDKAFGTYTVHVHLPGYEEVQPVSVHVKGTAPVEVPFELKRQVGALVLNSEPSGQDFVATMVEPAENVQRKGKTNAELSGLPTGKYVVEFGNGQKRDVAITAGGRVEIAIVGGASSASSTPAAMPQTNPAGAQTPTADVPQPAGSTTYSAGTAGAMEPPGSTAIKVSTSKPAYRNGEAVVCTVEIPYDGYLRIYSIDAQGNRVRIFPNKFEQNDKVHAGQKVTVPGNNEYDLKLELPPGLTSGTEAVHAVVSPQPFNDEPASSDASPPFQDLGPGSITELRSRGLKPQQKANFGEAAYTILP